MDTQTNHEERVRKLLRLADPTRNIDDGEAMNAFRRAAVIMREQSISFDDLFTVVEYGYADDDDPYSLSDYDLIAEMGECQGMSDWEINFTESLDRWVKRGKSLSEKQRATAVRILIARGRAAGDTAGAPRGAS